MNKRSVFCLTLAIFILTLTGIIYAAQTDESSLQEKEGDAIEKYNELLEYWSYNSDNISDFVMSIPEYYGGAYIDSDKNLVIQVTELNTEIEQYFSGIIDMSNVLFHVVENSFLELYNCKESVASKTSDSLITGVGIRVEENTVAVYVTNEISQTKAVSNIQAVANDLSEYDCITYYAAEEDMPLATLSPGAGFTEDGGSSRTLGYWAYDSSGNLGIVTAAHKGITAGETISINGSVFGVASTPRCSGTVDAVFIRRTNTGFTPGRVIQGWGISYNSAAIIELPVGATVRSYGNTSGAQTGTVLEISYTSTTYGISDLVRTTLVGAGGDSGGIVFAMGSNGSYYIAGIIHALHSSGVIYVKQSNIKNVLGVTIY